jgi:pimeloyl-ACP methyl ester carboxylesterase/DNA-binding CsgD family transcriptional regulator
MGATPRQIVRYLTTSDGVRLAWADAGSGRPLVKAANWLSHLEYDLESPVWRHWIAFFTSHFRLVRYDERGVGMSDRRVPDLSLERRVLDLEAVIDAADLTEPVMLLGISQGAAVCISYAVRHPDRVSRMVLCGGYARGALRRGPVTEQEYRAIADLAALWGRDNPAFRQVFTSRFIPDGTDEQLRWFNELCTKTASPEMAGPLLLARGNIDVSALLQDVKTPTLILHAREDQIAPLAEGRSLASAIAAAQFVELDSRNHVLLECEPAWTRFQQAVLEFTGEPSPRASLDPAFAALSRREREILALLVNGLSNADMADRLGISNKTVRNHLSNLFDKLGVWSRAQAIVFAHDRGFVS